MGLKFSHIRKKKEGKFKAVYGDKWGSKVFFFFFAKFCSLQSLCGKMALRNFYNEIKGLPNHVKPMLSINYVKSVFHVYLIIFL